MKRRTTLLKLNALLIILQSIQFAIDSILHPAADPKSNCGHIFKKTVCFDDFVHFFAEEKILTSVDLIGITPYAEAPTKVGEINRERKNSSRPCEVHPK